MTAPCELLDLFADGELPATEADAFRDHLADCEHCQRGLHDRMQLDRLAHDARQIELAPRRRRRTAMFGATVALGLAAAVVLVGRCPGSTPPPDESVAVALGTTRAVEGRLALAEARAYRPYDVMRDGSGPRSVPLGSLAALEARGAFHEIASIYLAAGDLDRAAEFLGRAAPGKHVDNDRAVIELARHRPAEALALLDATLETDPTNGVARWNRALALAALGLDLAAAAAFEAVAATAEPGWSEEARRRAEKIRDAATRRRTSLEEAMQAGMVMIEHGTPVPDALIRAHPGHTRRAFYEAVRAASDAATLARLAPVAAQLDALAGGRRLSDRLAATRTLDSARRRDAAAAYRAVVLGQQAVAPAEVDGFLKRMRASGDPDLVIGAVYALGPLPARETDELVRLAEADGDPWFRLVAAQEDAARLRAAGRLLDAEARLLALDALCATPDPSLSLRCTLRDHFLGEGYAMLHRLDEARARAAAEHARTRATGDWLQESAALSLAAQVALLDGDYALAKAYLDEIGLRRPKECAVERFAHLALAQAAQNQMRPEHARAELAAAPRCDEPLAVAALNVEADLARFERAPERVAAARQEIEALRASTTAPGELARLAFLEGRLRAASEPAAAEALLRDAIVGADRVPSDPDASKVRGYAFSTLAVLAAARGDHAAVVALLAEEARQRPPERCALAVAVDDERVVVALRDAAGAPAGAFTAQRAPGPIDPERLVPSDLVAKLRACAEVQVFARPPVQGRARLLPPGIAFVFRDSSARPDGARRDGARPDRPVRAVTIIAEDPPASLGLPRLAGAGAPKPGEQRLDGSAATPDAALAAMRDASELVIHAHGRVDLAVSSASHLVLSRDSTGRFALTAGAIAAQRFSGRPVVVLAACRAAVPAAQVHEPWSLPSAFLRAGARAVFASMEPIPDRASAAFFDAVLAEVREGVSPAVALERVRSQQRPASGPRAWFESVVVFE